MDLHYPAFHPQRTYSHFTADLARLYCGPTLWPEEMHCGSNSWPLVSTLQVLTTPAGSPFLDSNFLQHKNKSTRREERRSFVMIEFISSKSLHVSLCYPWEMKVVSIGEYSTAHLPLPPLPDSPPTHPSTHRLPR